MNNYISRYMGSSSAMILAAMTQTPWIIRSKYGLIGVFSHFGHYISDSFELDIFSSALTTIQLLSIIQLLVFAAIPSNRPLSEFCREALQACTSFMN